MNTEIRTMTEQDWNDVRNIYLEGITEGKSTFQTTAPSYEQWDQGHISDCRFVATVDDRVIGWIAISPTSQREAFRGVVEVSIYISHEYQHMGVGKKLLQCLCKESEEKGYWCLYSSIFALNEGSIRLHKSCGFREVGYREKIAKDRFGTWQDTIIMERRNNIG